MANINYNNLEEVRVRYQHELDDIPKDFKGRIIILGKNIVVRDRQRVILYDNSSAVLYGKTDADLFGTSKAVLQDYSTAKLFNYANAELHKKSKAILQDNSSAKLCDNSKVLLRDDTTAKLFDDSKAILYRNSTATLYDHSSAELFDTSKAVLQDNSTAKLYCYANATLYDHSSAELFGNSQVLSKTSGNIITNGNSRIIYEPNLIKLFMDFYGIKYTDTTATLYKAVHKINGEYISNYDAEFKYVIGESIRTKCDPSIYCKCSDGIHISHLNYAIAFGSRWDDLAILEVETKIDDIVLPQNSDGNIRTSCVKVIREVPQTEWGIYGEIIL